MSSQYSILERGAPYSESYRIYFKKGDDFISPWHDIPLFADEKQKIYNMVCEIPRWTNAKMEISTKEPLNPVRQDIKKGKVRFVDNCFPYKGYIWNYGAFPQTWEDPQHVDEHTKAVGDNDPIDVLEIGQRVAKRGQVLRVKVLGLIALIDEGETDWKVITIDVDDPLASQLNDIDDVDRHCKGLLEATRQWLTIYKMPTGKPANQFGLQGKFQNKAFAETIVSETNGFWKALVGHKGGDLWSGSFGVTGHSIAQQEATAVVNNQQPLCPAVAIDSVMDKWHFVDHKN